MHGLTNPISTLLHPRPSDVHGALESKLECMPYTINTNDKPLRKNETPFAYCGSKTPPTRPHPRSGSASREAPLHPGSSSSALEPRNGLLFGTTS